jgi:hypothetical protein
VSDAGPLLFGHELDRPETAVCVRVRQGRARLTDGPLAEATDLLRGLDAIECADLDAAVTSLSRLGPASVEGTPYLLLGWVGPDSAPVLADRHLIDAIEGWRREVDQSGRYVMGSAFGGIEAIATLRLRDERTLAADSPFTDVHHEAFTIDVVLCREQREAIHLAAGHPLALEHVIEVRPFLGPQRSGR